MLIPRRLFLAPPTAFLLSAIGAMTFSSNLYLTSWLPVITPPFWTVRTPSLDHSQPDKQHYQQQKHLRPEPSVVTLFRPEAVDDLVHIVTTRFMQYQPSLLALGEARLKLFETFCLPSMLGQSIDNFFWIVLTDPALPRQLMERLITLLSPHPNVYLVLCNNSTLAEALSHTILTGDLDRLHSAVSSNRRHQTSFLQTRVDADDALSRQTLAQIQDVARGLPKDTTGWQVICVKLHFEWRNDELTVPPTTQNQTVASAGKIRLVQENICVTPGFTYVIHRNHSVMGTATSRNSFPHQIPILPRIFHHLVVREWPECQVSPGNATKDCWKKLPKYYPAALRSRTITSAGMSRITDVANAGYDNYTNDLWPYALRDYGISQHTVIETSQYLMDHFTEIVTDNLLGQWYVYNVDCGIELSFNNVARHWSVHPVVFCLQKRCFSSEGHSCKKTSKQKLENLLNNTIPSML
jgi:hypothetical protein